MYHKHKTLLWVIRGHYKISDKQEKFYFLPSGKPITTIIFVYLLPDFFYMASTFLKSYENNVNKLRKFAKLFAKLRNKKAPIILKCNCYNFGVFSTNLLKLHLFWKIEGMYTFPFFKTLIHFKGHSANVSMLFIFCTLHFPLKIRKSRADIFYCIVCHWVDAE